MATLDLLKRSELARGLTNPEEDANKTAVETFINGILAGTAGYEAGKSLNSTKLNGVAATPAVNGGANSIPMLNSGGNLLVGGSAAGNHGLSKSAAAAIVVAMENTANVNGDFCLGTYLGANCVNATSYHYVAYSGGATKYLIFGNGTTWSASDMRLKTNINTARGYLSDLCKLRVVNYNWRATPESQAELGLIAQEVEKIFPGLVAETANVDLRQRVVEGKPLFEQTELSPGVTVDDETRPIMEQYQTGETTKGIKYSILVPMLLTAVQELSARVAALEAK